jgi:phosphoribosylformylglycinamidine synthase
MSVRIGVVVFPGSNCDRDTMHALALAGAEPVELWHETASLEGAAGVVLPGGFAYGDYLRAGVIARFSPVMRAVAVFAEEGGLVLGICNGFQVLAEAALVPGALLRNRGLRFLGRDVRIAVEQPDTPFTHLAGRATLDALEAGGGVLFRYVHADGTVAGETDDPANPNGSLRAIAGVRNTAGNVAGLMPHPERASEGILGSDDGFGLVRSFVESAAAAARGERSLEVATR